MESTGSQRTSHADRGRGDNARPVVLVVEDHPDLRQGLSTYLQLSGYDARPAKDFEEAIRIAEEQPPQVAICDRELGEERDGVDVARELQRRYNVAILFVSGTAAEDLINDASDLTVLAYLQKPVSPPDIERFVRDAVPDTARTDGSN